MSYTPINWQTGDTITAEKLNKMDNDWGVESTQLFSETVTTVANPEYPEDGAWGDLAYSTMITTNTLTVTFDGTEYVCEKTIWEGANAYGGLGDGGLDFSTIPFLITSYESEGTVFNSIGTENGGTHTVTIMGETIVCGNSFTSAVQSVAGVFYITATYDETANGYTLNKSAEQIQSAYTNGKLCRIIESNNSFTTDVIPYGAGFELTPFTKVSINENLLVGISFDFDQQTGVLTADIELYPITPAP